MTIFLIVLSAICIALVALFIFIGIKTRPGGGSLPNFKIPSWITWGRFFTTFIVSVLGFGGYNFATSTWNTFFPEEEAKVYVARAEVGDTGMIFFSIPKIPDGYQNLIVFAKPWGFKFNKGYRPAIKFPNAELIQSNEGPGAKAARVGTNKVLGTDHKEPKSRFRGSMTGVQPGLPSNVLLIREGAELHFKNGRSRHVLVIPQGAKLGDFPHIRYTLKLAEEKES